ncbi:BPI fold-containing family A member 1-like [Ornithorhynchus anatinus]|uniref:BPI fold-containing family A member 1-like n=1 Tax=Ornithorhynchus anatinus TaxID=9258 RepID=UPI0010A933AC|nr:BPI fold-containing family A member 1-like [Ornithorhynchus anatinus]
MKMFHFWGLLSCSLLLGATAQLPLPTGPPPPSLGTDLVDGLSRGLLRLDLAGILQKLPLLDSLLNEGTPSGGLLGGLLPKVIKLLPGLEDLVGIKVADGRLLQIVLHHTPDGHRLLARIPLSLVLSVQTPLTGQLIELGVRLDVVVTLKVEKDASGKTSLVVGDCGNDPASLNITLLNGSLPEAANALVNNLTGILDDVLPKLVQDKVCPLVNKALTLLDNSLLNDLTDQLLKGLSANITI